MRIEPMAAALLASALMILPNARASDELPSSESASQAAGIVLGAPPLEDWRDDGRAAGAATATHKPRRSASVIAQHYAAPIYAHPNVKSTVVGYARAGARVPVREQAEGSGCSTGQWYEVTGGGHVCTSRGFSLEGDLGVEPVAPAVSEPLPFRYGQVKLPFAPRLTQLPTEAEAARIDRVADSGGRFYPPVVHKRLEGVWFLTIDRTVEHHGRKYLRTEQGYYVRGKDVEVLKTPPMFGEVLDGPEDLPLAFVHLPDRPLLCKADGEVRRCGVARKHARFYLDEVVEIQGRRFLASAEGRLVADEDARVAVTVPRPRQVAAQDKWIHVDLSEQTLVAYEGDRPVYATLVSSGKPPKRSPVGLFHIKRKAISATMRGVDPDGPFTVEDVPWTMYFLRGFALHGAYWHNDFGTVRSHGCINAAPVDARWLFHWSDPGLPEGWHIALVERKTWIYLTR